eukprot:CAMPEP_0183308148 /NCGR_PEP_ID=MMETSP0160_2-20130417/20090_1 /TAXON_ID=2839 ORGANISM="Odontella Sinensis, Strain Grunow 1884" /NCGR_SAMPLE_ID=MMETSP0160_2 /ASSEMBLY_ACC=CAM_ASM_000250 /LENGTH=77 /DNA_ID=CAMNT_0025471911 /DNA_START=32 /DNA_END=265 /DNA_ORIENTATION=-
MATGALSRTGSRLAASKPNRLTAIISDMKQSCPDEMKAYASCVVAKQKAGVLEKGSCESEFLLVKRCFREVRFHERQ